MNLQEARKEIDGIDKQMKDLFVKRMGLSKCVARIKAETGDSIYKPEREKEILDTQSRDVDPDIAVEYRELMRKILELSRRYQERLIAGIREETI